MMSTYNGERYIQEQITSILQQRNVNIHLSIRDDGSTDKTSSILKDFMQTNKNISYEYGENIGYEKSFYQLLKENPGYEYYAFSDDDDMWDDDKLISGINRLHKENYKSEIPFVCWSALRITDENLKYVCDMERPKPSDFEKGCYLLDRYGYGATMVFNEAMRNLAVEHEPTIKISHDNWIGLLAIFLGKHCFDDLPHISYRQHGTNIVGGNNGFIGTWKRRIKNFKKIKDVSRSNTALNLLDGYREKLSVDDIELLETVAYYKKSLRNKIKLINNKNIYRSSKEKNMIFKVQVLLNIA